LTDTGTFDAECGSVPRFNRFERKFPLPPGTETSILAWLLAGACPDRDYPEGVINSVYFDTPTLEYLFDALNGDFRKRKIRLRWYDRAPGNGDRLAFLEVKSKRGALSEKLRRPVVFNPSDDDPLKAIERLQVPKILSELNVIESSWLRPVLRIRYCRRRFMDPHDGTPISLDTGIESLLLDRSLAASPGWLPLRNAVVEIKGQETAIPRCLHQARRHMQVWTSFSKYAQCLTAHLEDPAAFATKRII